MSMHAIHVNVRLLRLVSDVCGAAATHLTDLQRSARFLSERAAFQPRSDDVFISSYPRSGTTWLQLLVKLVLYGGGIDFRHINDVVPWYERSLALGRKSAQDFNALSSPRAFKSHLPYAWLPEKGRLIYVRRNAEDVLLSYYGLYCSHLGYREDLDAFTERFVRGRVQYGSWYEHVAHWEKHRKSPRVLWLDYEHMRSSPRAALEQVGAFLGVALSPTREDEILAASSLERMKSEEERFDHGAEERHQLGMQPGKFLGRGRDEAHIQLGAKTRSRLTLLSTQPTVSSPRWTHLPAFLH